jgi:ribonuclease T1
LQKFAHCGTLAPSNFRVYPRILRVLSGLVVLFYKGSMRKKTLRLAVLSLGLVVELVLGSAVGLSLGTNLVQAKSINEAFVSGPIAFQELPKEGQETYRLIREGGPFRYDKDGVVFGNRERLLPPEKRGFYREYTVKTPGEKNRGARRIVCGGLEPRLPKQCYYTQDHYASFREIVNTP